MPWIQLRPKPNQAPFEGVRCRTSQVQAAMARYKSGWMAGPEWSTAVNEWGIRQEGKTGIGWGGGNLWKYPDHPEKVGAHHLTFFPSMVQNAPLQMASVKRNCLQRSNMCQAELRYLVSSSSAEAPILLEKPPAKEDPQNLPHCSQ